MSFFRTPWPTTLVNFRQTNFTASEKELLKLFHQPSLQDFFGQRKIDWIFNPPKAPHFGGVWERLIRSCKDAFFAILGSKALTDDTFHTLLTEVEHFMNNRPLTAVSSDSGDIEPLTPIIFCWGVRTATFHSTQPISLLHQSLNSGSMVSNFKKFYPSLIPRQKLKAISKPLKSGSVVWILQEFTPRGFGRWAVLFLQSLTAKEINFQKVSTDNRKSEHREENK